MLFQNCGPAKLSSSGSADTGSTSQALSVGSKVDVPALLGSTQENTGNVLYPALSTASEFDYALGSPIIQNIVLKNNDFSQIIWVHGPSSTVVATGDSFDQAGLTSDQWGIYYVFGYRGQIPYLITQLKMAPNSSSTLNINSVGAVQIIQSSVASDSLNEWILLQVNAPYVNFNSIQFVTPAGAVNGKRAVLITKKLTDNVSVQINMTDMSGQNSSVTVTLPAKISATPTPSPTATPVSTPVPTPTVTPKPTATPISTPTPTPTPVPTPTPSPTPSATPVPTPTPSPTPTPLPDVIVTSISMSPANPVDGQAVTFSAVVKNQGSGATPAGVVIGVSFQIDGVAMSWSDTDSASLAPGASVTLTANNGPNNSATYTAVAGTHTLTAWVNDVNRFAETNTTNNKKSVSITVASATTEVCGSVAENSTLTLSCPSGKSITNVVFASYGDVTGGSCGAYTVGSCSASNSMSYVQSVCLGKSSCSVPANNTIFGDPCVGMDKSLTVDVQCN